MSIKNMLYTAVLAMFMILASCFTVFAADDMKLETINGTDISGYAMDSDDMNKVLTVTVTIQDQESGEVLATRKTTAELYREDLESEGYDDGCYGFEVSVNWDEYETDGPFIITASADGEDFPNSLAYHNGEIIEAEQVTDATVKSLGVFKTTAYCPCLSCSEGWGSKTCTGAVATANHTIAVDPRVIPLGSQVMIDGIVYTAEDRGGGVKGNHIDIYFDHHSDTYNYGKRNVEVFLVS